MARLSAPLLALLLVPRVCGAASVVRRGDARAPAAAPPGLPLAAAAAKHRAALPTTRPALGPIHEDRGDAPQQRKDAPENSAAMSSVWRTYLCAIVLTVSMIGSLYWRKGVSVVLKVMVYVGALTTMKGAVKVVEDQHAFRFPLFLTGTHFVSGALLAFTLLGRDSLATGTKIAAPTLKDFAKLFVPIAIAFASSVAMNNIALVHSTTAFVEIVGASTPLVTVFMTLIMKQPFDSRLLGPCLLVFLGCALSSKGEPRFSTLGFLLAAGSNVPRSLKGVLQQMLLQSDSNTTFCSPLVVLAWTCVPSSLIMFGWSLCQEGTEPYHQLKHQASNVAFWGALLLSCVNACILNTANLFVLKDLGAVGTQLVAQTKSLLVVLGGMCVLNEQVPRLEFVGFVLVMLGVYTYNDLEARLRARPKAEKGSPEEKRPLVKGAA